jgi:hypothetical protein
VRTDGDWEGWLDFFARAVKETADQCTETAVNTNRIAQADRAMIQGLGRIAGSALMVHQAFLAHPLTTIAKASKSTGLVPNTVREVPRPWRKPAMRKVLCVDVYPEEVSLPQCLRDGFRVFCCYH